MENFKVYESSNTNILEELRNKSYIVLDYEIQDVIDRLYELVGVNEDYIDEVILAIEKLCDNNEEFKKEWFGALGEVLSEVLEEEKIGKLVSIALFALSTGTPLTGCDVASQLPQEPPRVEISTNDHSEYSGGIEGDVTEDGDADNMEDVDKKGEINMEGAKPTYSEIKNDIKWYIKKFEKAGIKITVKGIWVDSQSEERTDEYLEVQLTLEDRSDRYYYSSSNSVLIPVKVLKELSRSGVSLYYSIGDGEIKPFNVYDPPYIN